MSTYALPSGTLLSGKYELHSVIGRGGFGITYEAFRIPDGERLAIKEFFWNGHMQRSENGKGAEAISPEEVPDVRDLLLRFLREAEVLRQFNSEKSVVRVEECFEENNTAYIVMEYIDGCTLEQLVRERGSLDAEELVRSVLPLLGSLQNIHTGGWIHRDISPDNLMFLPDGSLKLLDFGAVKQYEEQKLRKNSYYQKSSYSPPEQYDAGGKLGPWTDIYSLCASLYRCITGFRPPDSLARMHDDTMPAPSQLGENISTELERALIKGLALEPGRRWQDAGQLKAALEAGLPEKRLEKRRRRRKTGAFAAAAILLALCLAAGLRTLLKAQNPLYGMETESFFFYTRDEVSEIPAERQMQLLAQEAEALTGGLYILKQSGEGCLLTVPADCLEEEGACAAVASILENTRLGSYLGCRFVPDVNWETGSASFGANQCLPEDFTEPTVVLLFGNIIDQSASASDIAETDSIVKLRLDLLESPYAYGKTPDGMVAVRISPSRVNGVVEQSLFSSCNVMLQGADTRESDSSLFGESNTLSVVETEPGRYALRYDYAGDYFSSAEELKELLMSGEESEIYISVSDTLSSLFCGLYYSASARAEAQVEDGALLFDRLLAGGGEITEDNLWMLNYLCECINSPTAMYSLKILAAVLLDENGEPLLEKRPSDSYTMEFPIDLFTAASYDYAQELAGELPYEVECKLDIIIIELGLPRDGIQLAEGLDTAIGLLSDHQDFCGMIALSELEIDYSCSELWLFQRIDFGAYLSAYKTETGRAIDLYADSGLPGLDALQAAWLGLSLPDGMEKGEFTVYDEPKVSALTEYYVLY